MKRSLGTKHDYIIIGGVLVLVYFTFSITFGYIQDIHQTMFWTPDSRSYRSVGEWLLSLVQREPISGGSDATLVRPFFYPFLLAIAYALGGIYGIWIIQFMLWLVSGILLYLALKRVARCLFIVLCGLCLFVGNLTLIILTFHALTEVLTTFLLTVLVILITNKESIVEDKFWFSVIFVVSLLTATKPVYIILLIIIISYRIIAFSRAKQRLQSRMIYFLLAISPVLLQIGIMRMRHNTFSISKIGFLTVKYYYMSQIYSKLEGLPIHEARMYVQPFCTWDMLVYLVRNYKLSIYIYLENIKENILTKSNFINPKEHLLLFGYMIFLNGVYFVLHLLMLPLVLVLFVILIVKYQQERDFRKQIEKVVYLLTPFLLILVTSGITFWQGDRIVLPSLPLWITLYALTLSTYLDLSQLSCRT